MRTSKLFPSPFLFLFLIATNSPAQEGQVDFSGVWYLQKDRSEPSDISSRIAALQLVVTQEQDAIAIERMYNSSPPMRPSLSMAQKFRPNSETSRAYPVPTGLLTDKASPSQPKPSFAVEAVNLQSLRAKRGVCKKAGKS